MGVEQRHFKRIIAQRFGGCGVKLRSPAANDAVLVDISVGGMKILIEKDLPESSLASGTPVSGEIASESPSFRMTFSGKVAWQRRSSVDGQVTIALGLSFADYTPLPEPLMHLVENYDAV